MLGGVGTNFLGGESYSTEGQRVSREQLSDRDDEYRRWLAELDPTIPHPHLKLICAWCGRGVQGHLERGRIYATSRRDWDARYSEVACSDRHQLVLRRIPNGRSYVFHRDCHVDRRAMDHCCWNVLFANIASIIRASCYGDGVHRRFFTEWCAIFIKLPLHRVGAW